MASGTITNFATDSGTNYCKMSDGTLIQWGEAIIPIESPSITVTFPLPFFSANYSITAMGVFTFTRDIDFVYAAQTTTKIDIYHGAADLTHAVGFKWMAVGRWK